MLRHASSRYGRLFERSLLNALDAAEKKRLMLCEDGLSVPLLARQQLTVHNKVMASESRRGACAGGVGQVRGARALDTFRNQRRAGYACICLLLYL